jgi:flagellar basal-body rod modification protein FlgD
MTTNATSSTNAAATAAATSSASSQQIAGNFDEFLQMLTTQLQNQDPLDPMDTNSFTQELVEFASVEQQIDMNTNMSTLISLQQATTDVSALQLVGSTVTVSGTSATLASGGSATWSLDSPSAATGNVTITNSSGQTVYTGTTSLTAGTQSYSWNGQGTNGVTEPAGSYTLAISATTASGQSVTVSTQVQGTVSAVNTSANPPTLTVNGQTVPISEIQSITSSGSSTSGLSSSLSSLNSTISSLNSSLSSLSQLL